MKIINNVPTDLEGADGETITVQVTASGTVFAIAYDLDGSSGALTDPLKFTLKKTATKSVSVLVLFFTFSGNNGGVYDIRVSGSGGGDVSSYKVIQFPNQPSNAIAYAINIG